MHVYVYISLFLPHACLHNHDSADISAYLTLSQTVINVLQAYTHTDSPPDLDAVVQVTRYWYEFFQEPAHVEGAKVANRYFSASASGMRTIVNFLA